MHSSPVGLFLLVLYFSFTSTSTQGRWFCQGNKETTMVEAFQDHKSTDVCKVTGKYINTLREISLITLSYGYPVRSVMHLLHACIRFYWNTSAIILHCTLWYCSLINHASSPLIASSAISSQTDVCRSIDNCMSLRSECTWTSCVFMWHGCMGAAAHMCLILSSKDWEASFP